MDTGGVDDDPGFVGGHALQGFSGTKVGTDKIDIDDLLPDVRVGFPGHGMGAVDAGIVAAEYGVPYDIDITAIVDGAAAAAGEDE